MKNKKIEREMNLTSWFLSSLEAFSIISSIHSNELVSYSSVALTFNPETLVIYKTKDTTAESSQGDVCAVACPAENENEKKLLENNSMRSNSLFLKTITTVQHCNENPIKCQSQNNFELTLLIHYRKDGNFLEFGYEVYFEKETFLHLVINSSNPFDFREVKHEANIIRVHSAKLLSDYFTPLTKNQQRKEQLKKWGLIWVPKIELRYSVSRLYFKSMRYLIDTMNIDELLMECENYDLGSAELQTSSQKQLEYYSSSNQIQVFSKVVIPRGSCDKYKQDCVRKYDLLMPYHYLSYDPNSISCSNLTSVTIWNHTLPDELMERIKLFLIAVAQVANRKLLVLPGVIGTLTLPTSWVEETYEKMYLDSTNKKMPVPRLVYKLVRYKSHECNEVFHLCWFNIIIVIQNDPDPTVPKLCLKDKCQELGWDFVQLSNIDIRDTVNEYVYCCTLTKKIAKEIHSNMDRTKGEDLNLNHFPIHVNGKLRYERIQHKFEDEYIELKRIMSAP